MNRVPLECRNLIPVILLVTLVFSGLVRSSATLCLANPVLNPASDDGGGGLQEDIIRAQLDALDTTALKGFLEDMDSSMKEFFPPASILPGLSDLPAKS